MVVGQSWIPATNGGSVRRSHSHAVGRARDFAMPPGYQKGVSAGVNAASGLLGLSLPILLYGNANCNRQFPKLCLYFADRSVFARAAALPQHNVRNLSLQPLASIILGSLRNVEFVPPYESFLYFACREFVGLLFFEILLKCSQND